MHSITKRKENLEVKKIMPEIKIDKNIPIPNKFPFDELEIGDSFFVENYHAQHIGVYFGRARKRTGFQFKSRTVKENGKSGVRVWRIE